MKKLMMALAAAATVVVTGCKTVPTPETVESLSFSAGVAAGLVVQLKVPAETAAKVVDIVNSVSGIVPAGEETFEAVWTPIVDKYVAEAVAAGKITESEASLVKYAMTMVEKTLDYLFAKYPKWRNNKDLVAACVRGLCKGFCSVFDTSARAVLTPDPDVSAYLLKVSRSL